MIIIILPDQRESRAASTHSTSPLLKPRPPVEKVETTGDATNVTQAATDVT